jgi:hypothetical protein
MEEKKLRDKFPLAFRAPSPPLPSPWQDLTDDELMALEIPGVDPTAPPALHMDQIDMQIAEKLRVRFFMIYHPNLAVICSAMIICLFTLFLISAKHPCL